MSLTWRPRLADVAFLVALTVLAVLPPFMGTFVLNMFVLAFFYVTLAVAFDLVAGRVGALSLAQPLFVLFGSYAAALLATKLGFEFWAELGVAAIGAAVVALAVGIPSFRLSLHSFAIGTLGFALIGQLVANNWTDLTGGTLCVTGIPPATLRYPGGTFVATTLAQQYALSVGIALLAILVVAAVARSRLGLAYIAVRDDPILAEARGLWPTQLRISAFMISAMLSAVAGVFLAHHLRVVCPTQFDTSMTLLLLIMVFLGGRASLRGVISAAILFTVLPQVLRLTNQWRLVVFGALLLVVVTYAPAGLEGLYRGLERLAGRAFAGRGRSTEQLGAEPESTTISDRMTEPGPSRG